MYRILVTAFSLSLREIRDSIVKDLCKTRTVKFVCRLSVFIALSYKLSFMLNIRHWLFKNDLISHTRKHADGTKYEVIITCITMTTNRQSCVTIHIVQLLWKVEMGTFSCLRDVFLSLGNTWTNAFVHCLVAEMMTLKDIRGCIVGEFTQMSTFNWNAGIQYCNGHVSFYECVFIAAVKDIL